MQIYGPSQLHGPQSVNAPHSVRPEATSGVGGSGSISDSLDISPAAQLLDQVNQLPDIRQDRVSQLRASIADGSYETSDKLSSALDRLLDEIG